MSEKVGEERLVHEGMPKTVTIAKNGDCRRIGLYGLVSRDSRKSRQKW